MAYSMYRLHFFIFSISIINFSSSSELLNCDPPSPPPPPGGAATTDGQPLTFFMHDVLGDETNPSSSENPGRRVNAGQNIPFRNPRGISPPAHAGAATAATHPFLSTVQAVEFGKVTVIEEVLTEGMMVNSPLVGRVRGVYVTSSSEDDGSSHMVAMTAELFSGDGDDSEDSLRFFGLWQNI